MRAGSGVRNAIAVGVASLVLLSNQSATPAAAEPTPSPSPRSGTAAKLTGAKDQVKALEEKASEIGEQYDQATDALEEGKDRLKALKADIAAQQKKVDALEEQVRAIALAQFRNREVDTTVQIFTSGDPDTMLSRLSTSAKVDEDMNATLAEHQAEQANLTDLKRTEAAEVAALAAEQEKAADLKKQAEVKVDEAEALVRQLTTQQRRELEQSDGDDTDWDPGDVGGSPNAKALAAVKYAVAKARGGSRYVWGAEGPSSFDCSGLMLAAYRTVGISLPHSSRAQASVGRAVPKSALKPGDLLFWYHPIHHVGMYIGGGKIVHARSPRNGLQIQTLNSYPAPWAGARRVVG